MDKPMRRSASPAGYSGTPLARKLGIIRGTRLCTLDAPDDYRELLAPLPEDVQITTHLSKQVDIVHLFSRSRATLAEGLAAALAVLRADGAVWVSWPKKASKVQTEVTEDTIRELALPLGLVDIKVCAVDSTWSGLKLVIRRELRAGLPHRSAP